MEPLIHVFALQLPILMSWLISFLSKPTDFKPRGVFPSGEQQVFHGRNR